jgi:hypothetical protein
MKIFGIFVGEDEEEWVADCGVLGIWLNRWMDGKGWEVYL